MISFYKTKHNKYTGKEFDRMHGLDWYDYVARQYDPVYGRFTSIDPLCEKYPHLSPYAYCGNNPMLFVDPDGRRITINGDNKDEALEMLNQIGGKRMHFYFDGEGGNISYTINADKKGNPYKLDKNMIMLKSIIDDEDITVNLQATSSQVLDVGGAQFALVGGGFAGNQILKDGHVLATQYVNTSDMKKIGDYTHSYPILHEITEGYRGAQISRDNGFASPPVGIEGSVYNQAHKEALYPQNFIIQPTFLNSSGEIVNRWQDAETKEYRLFRNNYEYIVIKKIYK